MPEPARLLEREKAVRLERERQQAILRNQELERERVREREQARQRQLAEQQRYRERQERLRREEEKRRQAALAKKRKREKKDGAPQAKRNGPTKGPVCIRKREPSYPAKLRRQGIGGTVVVQAEYRYQRASSCSLTRTQFRARGAGQGSTGRCQTMALFARAQEWRESRKLN